MTVSVLLADDQHLVRAGFRSLLKRDREIVVAGEAATGDEAVRKVTVEPLTNYGLVLVAKDLRGGRTAIGAMATAVNRSLAGTGLDRLHDQAYTGGLDLSHRFAVQASSAKRRISMRAIEGAGPTKCGFVSRKTWSSATNSVTRYGPVDGVTCVLR